MFYDICVNLYFYKQMVDETQLLVGCYGIIYPVKLLRTPYLAKTRVRLTETNTVKIRPNLSENLV